MSYKRIFDDVTQQSLLEKLDTVEQRVKHLIQDALFARLNGYLKLIKKCESPIEQLMYITLDRACELLVDRHRKRGIKIEADVTPQVDIKTHKKIYRVDFLFAIIFDGRAIEFAIECDGHDFHEKTKEQAQHDKERDRLIQSTGIYVLRFTGSEIWQNPIRCAYDILDTIETLINTL